jgi:Predicted small integral membrane protein
MIAIRLSKAAMVAAIAFLASLVAFGNITDYWTNFAFVQHVLSMDTVFPETTIPLSGDRPALCSTIAAYVLIHRSRGRHGGALLDRRLSACCGR